MGRGPETPREGERTTITEQWLALDAFINKFGTNIARGQGLSRPSQVSVGKSMFELARSIRERDRLLYFQRDIASRPVIDERDFAREVPNVAALYGITDPSLSEELANTARGGNIIPSPSFLREDHNTYTLAAIVGKKARVRFASGEGDGVSLGMQSLDEIAYPFASIQVTAFPDKPIEFSGDLSTAKNDPFISELNHHPILTDALFPELASIISGMVQSPPEPLRMFNFLSNTVSIYLRHQLPLRDWRIYRRKTEEFYTYYDGFDKFGIPVTEEVLAKLERTFEDIMKEGLEKVKRSKLLP